MQDPPEVDMGQLVLDAQCEMAKARVHGPFDVGAAYEHAREARQLAYRAGLASAPDALVPLGFLNSLSLMCAWYAGQDRRVLPSSTPTGH
jgi:hypothetical protein